MPTTLGLRHRARNDTTRRIATCKKCILLTTVVAGLALPRSAKAQAEGLLLFPEPFVPDLRLELEASQPYLVLSLPVHVNLYRDHVLPITHEKAPLSLFVEPQYRPSGREWRGLAGLRLTQPIYRGFAALVEGAGLVGTDGHGGLFGVGVGGFEARIFNGVGWLAGVWRHAFTTEGQRNDFSIDLAYPIW